MSNETTADFNRWEELQVGRLLFGLSPNEQAEYDELALKMPTDKTNLFDSVVASIDVAWSGRPEPLPEHLQRSIQIQAEQVLASKPSNLAGVPSHEGKSVIGFRNYAPWLVAAASLALSVFIWNSNRPQENVTPSVAQLRAELITSTRDVVQADWSAGTTPIAGATGDVIWSSERQQGFMRFQGLPVNQPTIEQYQLWIFDKHQSDKTPVDGGVFDVRSNGEVIVPINEKLRIQEAVMFAVTIEKPGGVVVSSRDRLPLLAQVK